MARACSAALLVARAILAQLLLLLLFTRSIDGIHHEGDFIHTSRRAQFLRKRTQWHDLIEHHCPRFGHSRIVALPINKPSTEEDVSDYRVQLAFDGERIVTPWLTVIGRNVEGMPLVDVRLRRAGDELQGVRARVVSLPDELLLTHAALYETYQNTSAWPKHVMVHYAWVDEGGVNVGHGAMLVLALALVLFAVLAVNTLAGLHGKVGALLRDVVGSEPDPFGPPAGSGGDGGLAPFAIRKGGTHVE